MKKQMKKNTFGVKKLVNPWLKHVASEKKKYPKKYAGLKVGAVMSLARKTYKPQKK